jgi:hypothetical protein
MSYCNDLYVCGFTKNQIEKMRFMLKNYRGGLINPKDNLPPPKDDISVERIQRSLSKPKFVPIQHANGVGNQAMGGANGVGNQAKGGGNSVNNQAMGSGNSVNNQAKVNNNINNQNIPTNTLLTRSPIKPNFNKLVIKKM